MSTLCSQQQPNQQQYGTYPNNGGSHIANDQPPSNEIERLKWERQHLLDSGVYSQNDPLIKEFDKLIGAS